MEKNKNKIKIQIVTINIIHIIGTPMREKDSIFPRRKMCERGVR